MTASAPSRAPSPPASDEPLLSLRGIQKSFGAVHVLRGVDLDVRPGQVTALVGDNGAGKSTLIKGIAGIHAFDEGDYTFEGQPVHVHGPKDANALGIEVVYQDLALCDNLDVVHNMFLGREMTKGRLLDEDNDGGAGPRDPRRPLGAHAEVRAHPGRLAVRWPAPDRGHRPVRCCGTPRSSSSTSRPRRSAWPRPSRSSCWSADWPTTGLGVDPDQPQPQRRVPGRRRHRRALPRRSMVAQVRRADVTHNQVVELITDAARPRRPTDIGDSDGNDGEEHA